MDVRCTRCGTVVTSEPSLKRADDGKTLQCQLCGQPVKDLNDGVDLHTLQPLSHSETKSEPVALDNHKALAQSVPYSDPVTAETSAMNHPAHIPDMSTKTGGKPSKYRDTLVVRRRPNSEGIDLVVEEPNASISVPTPHPSKKPYASNVSSNTPNSSGVGGLLIICGLIVGGISLGMTLGHRYSTGEWQLPNVAQNSIQAERLNPKINQLIQLATAATDLDTTKGRQRALELLDEALSIAPEDNLVRLKRAEVLILSAMALERQADVEVLRQITEGTPDAVSKTAKTLHTRATTLLFSAKVVLDAASEEPDNGALIQARNHALATYYLATKNIPELRALLSNWPALTSKDPYRAYLDAAAQMALADELQGPDLKLAIEQLRNVLEQRPSMNRARILLTRCLVASGALKEASSVLQPVLDVVPNHDEALELQSAIGALENRPSYPDFFPSKPLPRSLGALPDYERWMSGALRRKKFGKTIPALNAYKKASEIEPLAAAPWVGMGWIFYEIRDYPSALNAFSQAVLLKNKNAAAQYGLGETHIRLGGTKAALEAFLNFVDLTSPDDPYRNKAIRRAQELANKLGIQVSLPAITEPAVPAQAEPKHETPTDQPSDSAAVAPKTVSEAPPEATLDAETTDTDEDI